MSERAEQIAALVRDLLIATDATLAYESENRMFYAVLCGSKERAEIFEVFDAGDCARCKQTECVGECAPLSHQCPNCGAVHAKETA